MSAMSARACVGEVRLFVWMLQTACALLSHTSFWWADITILAFTSVLFRTQGSAIMLELLGRKLLQYFQVSKGYHLTLIQESYTVCDYKFINNVLPSILTKNLQNSAEVRNTIRRFSEFCDSRQTNSRIIFQIRLRLPPLPHASQFILALDAIQFKLLTATLNTLHIKIITNSKKEPYETTKCNSRKPRK